MQKSLSSVLVLSFLFFLSSCQLIGGIFKAGVWVGIIIVVGIIGLVLYLISRFSNKN
jgi:hypothetical protein